MTGRPTGHTGTVKLEIFTEGHGARRFQDRVLCTQHWLLLAFESIPPSFMNYSRLSMNGQNKSEVIDLLNTVPSPWEYGARGLSMARSGKASRVVKVTPSPQTQYRCVKTDFDLWFQLNLMLSLSVSLNKASVEYYMASQAQTEPFLWLQAFTALTFVPSGCVGLPLRKFQSARDPVKEQHNLYSVALGLSPVRVTVGLGWSGVTHNISTSKECQTKMSSSKCH